MFLQVGPLKPPGGWVKSLQNLALKTAAPSRVKKPRNCKGPTPCRADPPTKPARLRGTKNAEISSISGTFSSSADVLCPGCISSQNRMGNSVKP